MLKGGVGMANAVCDFFKRPTKITPAKRTWLILLGILLFLSLLSFGPILALQLTALNPDYVATRVVDEMDISGAAHDWLSKNVAPDKPLAAKAIELGVINLEPIIKEGTKSAVSSIYSVMLDSLEKGKLVELVAAQRSLVNDVANNINGVLDSPILSPVISLFGINATSIQKNVDINQINSYFDALDEVAQARDAFIAAKNSFIPLIVFMVLLIIGIVLIARQVKFTTFELGITFAAYGAIELIGALIGKGYIISALSQLDMPQFLQNALQRINDDFINVLVSFSSTMLFCGAVLLVVYFLYKPRQLAAGKSG
jgi:hypothetical protein